MKLVMVYYCTDGCTFGYDITIPFEYESTEAAIVDFEKALHNGGYVYFQFAGREFSRWNFSEDDESLTLPEILTLEEWFEGYS